ncbi:MAG: hypothetical protein Q9228_005581 [Teloschistes exilis]
MSTICPTALFRRLVDLDVFDDEVSGVETLGVGVCFCVFEEAEEEFGGFDGPAGFGDAELFACFGDQLTLRSPSSTPSISPHRHRLGMPNDIVQVCDGALELPAVNGLGGFTGVFEGDAKVVEEVIAVGVVEDVAEVASATVGAEAVQEVDSVTVAAEAEREEDVAPHEEGPEVVEAALAEGGEVLKEPHRHPGVFVARGKEDMLVTKNLTPGESVYGEKRIAVESSSPALTNGDNTSTPTATKTEYRVWNPFRSKLAAGILGGLDDIFIRPGVKVLYLGAASGTSVSHVADIVGPTGTVYAVEFSHRSGRDLINMATHRTNVIPIIEDARHPLRYRMLVGMVDVIFADVAQPDQARIVGLNCHLYLKVGGGVVVSVKANCIDSTAAPEAVFAREVGKMREERIKPIEQLTLEPFERGMV